MADEDDNTSYEKAKEELVKALVKKRQCDKQLVSVSQEIKSILMMRFRHNSKYKSIILKVHT